MNSSNFLRCVKDKLLPNLPANSAVVVNNIKLDKYPTAATRKADVAVQTLNSLWLNHVHEKNRNC